MNHSEILEKDVVTIDQKSYRFNNNFSPITTVNSEIYNAVRIHESGGDDLAFLAKDRTSGELTEITPVVRNLDGTEATGMAMIVPTRDEGRYCAVMPGQRDMIVRHIGDNTFKQIEDEYGLMASVRIPGAGFDRSSTLGGSAQEIPNHTDIGNRFFDRMEGVLTPSGDESDRWVPEKNPNTAHERILITDQLRQSGRMNPETARIRLMKLLVDTPAFTEQMQTDRQCLLGVEHINSCLQAYFHVFGKSDPDIAIAIMLHDCGKAEALATFHERHNPNAVDVLADGLVKPSDHREEMKQLEMECTKKTLPHYFELLGIEPHMRAYKLTVALSTHDTFGQYMQGKMRLPDAINALEEIADTHGLHFDDLYEANVSLAKADWLSYTRHPRTLPQEDDSMILHILEKKGINPSQENIQTYISDSIKAHAQFGLEGIVWDRESVRRGKTGKELHFAKDAGARFAALENAFHARYQFRKEQARNFFALDCIDDPNIESPLEKGILTQEEYEPLVLLHTLLKKYDIDFGDIYESIMTADIAADQDDQLAYLFYTIMRRLYRADPLAAMVTLNKAGQRATFMARQATHVDNIDLQVGTGDDVVAEVYKGGQLAGLADGTDNTQIGRCLGLRKIQLAYEAGEKITWPIIAAHTDTVEVFSALARPENKKYIGGLANVTSMCGIACEQELMSDQGRGNIAKHAHLSGFSKREGNLYVKGQEVKLKYDQDTKKFGYYPANDENDFVEILSIQIREDGLVEDEQGRLYPSFVAHNATFDYGSAKQVYDLIQDNGIPLISIGKELAKSAPSPMKPFYDLMKHDHEDVQEIGIGQFEGLIGLAHAVFTADEFAKGVMPKFVFLAQFGVRESEKYQSFLPENARGDLLDALSEEDKERAMKQADQKIYLYFKEVIMEVFPKWLAKKEKGERVVFDDLKDFAELLTQTTLHDMCTVAAGGIATVQRKAFHNIYNAKEVVGTGGAPITIIGAGNKKSVVTEEGELFVKELQELTLRSIPAIFKLGDEKYGYYLSDEVV